MPAPVEFWTSLTAITTYPIVLAIPGALVGFAAGLRGWVLAGLTPLLTYTVAGLAGPWLAYLGLRYDVGTAAAVTVLLAGAAYGIRRLGTRRGWVSGEPDIPPSPWTPRAHAAVAACVLLATVLSTVVVLTAAGGTNAVFQRWDTVFHANGVRYIADTGDGGLFGMSTINWYDPGKAQFYPNAYHLVGALVYQLSGASVPAVLDAVTVPIAGLFALSMVAMIRQFGGRAVYAGCAAIIAGTATTGAYESVSSGLLPFALSVVLTPLSALALRRFLIRPGADTGTVLALTTVGLLATHSSAPFGAALFALPLVAQRWLRREGSPGRDLLRLAPVMAASTLMAAPHILGALKFSTGNYAYNPWGSRLPLDEAFDELLKFQQVLDHPQLWLSALLVVGVLSVWRLGGLRWVGASAVVACALFVLVACYGATPWVIALSRPWWNDRYRLMSLAAIPLCLLAAHGMAELQRLATRIVASPAWMRARPRLTGALAVATASGLVIGMAVVTDGFYAGANATTVAYAYTNGQEPPTTVEPPVSTDELAAMEAMRTLGVQPSEKVLNDRGDGTAWLYAITGIRPVAGHFDPSVPPRDARYLEEHFREYETDAEVRAAVRRLNVHHVLLGTGSINPSIRRAPGLCDLDGLPFLRRDYANRGAVIYTIVDPRDGPVPPPPAMRGR